MVLLPENVIRQDKINLLKDIESRIYPYKRFFHKGEDRPCRCTEQGASLDASCNYCQGTGRTLRNLQGKIDYWLLGCVLKGYILTGVMDPESMEISSWTSYVRLPS